LADAAATAALRVTVEALKTALATERERNAEFRAAAGRQGFKGWLRRMLAA
jgi:hypothetical protein